MAEAIRDRVAIITGASRGIGKAIALRLAGEGVHIVVAAKSTTEDPRIPGTIQATADAVQALGVKALAVQCDVRQADAIDAVVEQTLSAFGRIDILVNNAGAIWVQPLDNTPERRLDLVMEVNFRGPFLFCQKVIPHMRKSGWGHIINMSPPVEPDQVAGKIAYMASKFCQTLLAQGLGVELKGSGIACNALWPRTLVESLAVQNWKMGEPRDWRKADILADATLAILRNDPKSYTGQALIDEEVLRAAGVTDFERYNVVPGSQPRNLNWNEIADILSGMSKP